MRKLFLSKMELEERGPPYIKDRLIVLLGLPFLLIILSVEVLRTWRGLAGEPLLITGLADSDLTLRWSDSPDLFLLGLLFHVALISGVLWMLWGCLLEVQRWLHFRRQEKARRMRPGSE